MPLELTQFILQFFFVLFSCFTLYFLGRILLCFFPVYIFSGNANWFRSYAALVLGIVALVLVYSMVLTKGKTIHIVLLPVLAGLFFSRKQSPAYTNRESIFNNWPFLLLIVIPFLFVLLFHLFPESEYKQADAVHYLQISQFFNTNGQENQFGGAGLFGEPYKGTVPYHYFEFWLNAVLLKVFGSMLPGIQLLRVVCYAIISTAGVLGLLALGENMVKKPLGFWQKAVCICFIFYLPNFLGYLGFLRPVLIYAFENNILERPNLRTLYLFLPGILIVITHKKNEWRTLFWVVCAMVSSFIYFVVLLPATALYCLAGMLKKEDRRYLFFVLCAIFFTALLYFLFYHFTGSYLKITGNSSVKEDIIAYLLRYWKIILFSSTTSIFYCLLVPAVFLWGIRKYKKEAFKAILKANQPVIVFLLTAICCAVGIARVFNFTEDSYQFAFVGYSSGAIFLFVLLFSIAPVLKIKNWLYPVICLAFIFSFITPRLFIRTDRYANIFAQNGFYRYGGRKLTTNYIKDVLAAFPSGSVVNGCYWGDSLFYDTIPYYSFRNPNVYSLPTAYILANKMKCNFEVCLTDSASIMYGIDTTQKIGYRYLKSVIQSSVFDQTRGWEDINKRRLFYIEKYKLQYLILTKNADTSIIKQLSIAKYFQDSITGERFYVIRNNSHQ